MHFRLLAGVAAATLLTACTTMSDSAEGPASAQALPPIPQGTGYFAQPSTLPFEAPDFRQIRDTDYQPAIEQGIAIKLAEVEHIARNPAAPTFDNTIVAMERTGRMLSRALAAFGQVQGANTNDVLNAVVTVLADWARSPGGWASGTPDAVARPVGVVAMPSRTRPQLVGSLAEGVAGVGRLPLPVEKLAHPRHLVDLGGGAARR